MLSIWGYTLKNSHNTITSLVIQAYQDGQMCFIHFQIYIDQGGMDLFRNSVTVLFLLEYKHASSGNMSIKSIFLEPHFYIVKLGVHMGVPIFLIFSLTHRFWVFVRTASAKRSEREPTIYVVVFFFY